MEGRVRGALAATTSASSASSARSGRSASLSQTGVSSTRNAIFSTLRIRFQGFSRKGPEGCKGGPRHPKKGTKERQKEPKGAHGRPKASQKRHQGEAKGAKGSPRAAQGIPKNPKGTQGARGGWNQLRCRWRGGGSGHMSAAGCLARARLSETCGRLRFHFAPLRMGGCSSVMCHPVLQHPQHGRDAERKATI